MERLTPAAVLTAALALVGARASGQNVAEDAVQEEETADQSSLVPS